MALPDFSVQNNFPIASVIDAAQRNNALQLQARQAGQQSLIEGMRAIGQVGQSIYDQKQRIAQALAGAKQYAQTPEGQQVLGTNQVTQAMGQPVTNNQTAAYDPATGTVTPNQSPVTLQDIAKSMEGMAPKDIFENLRETKKLSYEPQKLAIEEQKAKAEEENRRLLLGLTGQMNLATIKNQESERKQASDKQEFEANKAILASGSPLNPFNPVTFAQKKAAMQYMTGNVDHSVATKWAKDHPNDPRSATILARANQATSGN